MQDDRIEHRAEASRRYFAALAGGRLRAEDIDEIFLSRVRSVRERFRREEGGGGACHLVTDWLEAEFGATRVGVSYISDAGDVCAEAHYVSILCDGTLVDATADQFGDPDDVRVVLPGDVAYARYRPEFHEDFHPAIPQFAKALLPFAADWSGLADGEQAEANRDEYGDFWWVEDPAPLGAYVQRQLAYASAAATRRKRGETSMFSGMAALLDGASQTSPVPRLSR